MTQPTYATGAVKQDPETKAVALRTDLPSEDGSMDWGVMTVNNGGHYASTEAVADWTDLS
jgi:hypothetical protein